MKRFFTNLRLIIVSFACSLFMIVGCKQEKVYVMGKVSGQIMLDGKPLQEGCVVVFHPAGGDTLHGSSVIAEGGKYRIAQGTGQLGVPVGEYKVTISPPLLSPEVQKQNEEKNQATIMKALVTRNASRVMKDLVILQTDIVPLKYRSQGSSPLKVTVKEGDNTSDFTLDPEPPKKN
ncbi:MAG: hypothetical protein ACK526_11680 [Planctomyces sp.]